MFPAFLEKESLSDSYIKTALQAWQQGVLKYTNDPLPALRRSLKIFPFDYAMAKNGVTLLRAAHLKAQNIEYYRKIEAIFSF